jgi:hypothetical protein
VSFLEQVKTLEQWNNISVKLSLDGYRLWQWQYDIHAPEGFHARFFALGKPNIEVVTHSKEVYDSIMKYQ